jgi:hypothetical protein
MQALASNIGATPRCTPAPAESPDSVVEAMPQHDSGSPAGALTAHTLAELFKAQQQSSNFFYENLDMGPVEKFAKVTCAVVDRCRRPILPAPGQPPTAR